MMVLNELLGIKVPGGLSVEMAALTEPLAVGVHAVGKSRIAAGESAIVLGLGPVGLAVIAELKMRGIGPIIAADFSPRRRALAAGLGADVVVDPNDEPAIAAWRRVDGTRPVVIFEAVGVPGMIDEAMRMAPKNARILMVGACMQPDTIHPMIGIRRELSIQFALGYEPAEFSASLAAIADGKVDLAPWLTGTVDIDGVPQAFADLANPEAHAKIWWCRRDGHLSPPIRPHPTADPRRAAQHLPCRPMALGWCSSDHAVATIGSTASGYGCGDRRSNG